MTGRDGGFKVIGGKGSGKSQLLYFLIEEGKNKGLSFLYISEVNKLEDFIKGKIDVRDKTYIIIDNLDEPFIEKSSLLEKVFEAVKGKGCILIISLRDTTLHSLHRINPKVAEMIASLNTLLEIYQSSEDLELYLRDLTKKVGRAIFSEKEKFKQVYLEKLIKFLLDQGKINSLKHLIRKFGEEALFLRAVKCQIEEKRKAPYEAISQLVDALVLLLQQKEFHLETPFDSIKIHLESVKRNRSEIKFNLVTESPLLQYTIKRRYRVVVLSEEEKVEEESSSIIRFEIARECGKTPIKDFFICMPRDILVTSSNCPDSFIDLAFDKTGIEANLTYLLETAGLANYILSLLDQASIEVVAKSLAYSLCKITYNFLLINQGLLVSKSSVKDYINNLIYRRLKRGDMEKSIFEGLIDTILTSFEMSGIVSQTNEFVFLEQSKQDEVLRYLNTIAHNVGFKINFYLSS